MFHEPNISCKTASAALNIIATFSSAKNLWTRYSLPYIDVFFRSLRSLAWTREIVQAPPWMLLHRLPLPETIWCSVNSIRLHYVVEATLRYVRGHARPRTDNFRWYGARNLRWYMGRRFVIFCKILYRWMKKIIRYHHETDAIVVIMQGCIHFWVNCLIIHQI